jgi:hypothetical protein
LGRVLTFWAKLPEGIYAIETDDVATIKLSPQGLNRLRKKGK